MHSWQISFLYFLNLELDWSFSTVWGGDYLAAQLIESSSVSGRNPRNVKKNLVFVRWENTPNVQVELKRSSATEKGG